VPPALRRQIGIREQNLTDAVGVFYRDRLALSGLARVVVKFGEPQDVAGYLDEIGLSVPDSDRQWDWDFPAIVGCNARVEARLKIRPWRFVRCQSTKRSTGCIPRRVTSGCLS
jgi:hypothetical protein